MQAKRTFLILGDLFSIAMITLIGFATHGEAAVAFIPRMGTTFLPVVIGWFLIAPWFGLLEGNIASNPKFLWRIPLAMLFSAPMAGILRAAWLHSTALPIFILVLGGTNGLGMILWRALFAFYIQQNKSAA